MTTPEPYSECLSFLVEDERKVFLAIATFLGLEPHELLWACVDTIMNSTDDIDVLKGCCEAVECRYQGYVLPDWAEFSQSSET
ncbi:hypothetical protein MLD52_20645 [Puniceicoccaceae bacterium K14]|nr:hypothetical protein [Puniceicoccaceae bacterium K14]